MYLLWVTLIEHFARCANLQQPTRICGIMFIADVINNGQASANIDMKDNAKHFQPHLLVFRSSKNDIVTFQENTMPCFFRAKYIFVLKIYIPGSFFANNVKRWFCGKSHNSRIYCMSIFSIGFSFFAKSVRKSKIWSHKAS